MNSWPDSPDFEADIPAAQKRGSNAKIKGHPDGCPFIFGGDKRDRTADLLNAIQALSQLSYTPTTRYSVFSGGDKRDRTADLLNAIQALSQLSYTPT